MRQTGDREGFSRGQVQFDVSQMQGARTPVQNQGSVRGDIIDSRGGWILEPWG